MQNAHWQLVVPDTAHSKHDLDFKQTAWLAAVAAADRRQLILFLLSLAVFAVECAGAGAAGGVGEVANLLGDHRAALGART